MGLTDTLIKAQKVATFKRSLAIVIGINEYQNKIPKLKTARRDAEVLAEILEKEHQYDEVVLITDETEFKPTFQNLLILLEERLPKEIKPTNDDRLLFYFAGHGIARDSDKGPAGCLVPQDADIEKQENLLPMQKLHECLTALSCRHLLVILDCCFAGTFRWSSTRLATVIPRVVHKEHYDRFIKSPAWQAITSAAHNQEALDVLCDNRGGANHSPFAEGLFKALRGEGDLIPAGKKGQPPGDGVITAAELYLYLRDHVELSSQERQTPGIWTLSKHDRGEFIFLVPGADLKLKPAPTLHENNNPYRGLSAFEEEHSQFFFGRQELIEELYQRIAHTDETYSQLTVVLGTSGSGKSSLVKAGLIPCLRQKYSQYWCILKPMRPGESPFTALARTILPITNVPVTNQLENLDFISEILQEELKRLDQEIYDTFDGSEEGTDKRIRLEQEENKFNQIADTWNSGTPNKRLLLVVEQFEELNNLCRNDDERERLKQAFLDSINPLSERLQTDSKQFIEIIAAWSQQHLDIRLLLVIDQFEELITLSRNTQDDKQNSKPNESQQFVKLLEETLAATLPQLSIIVTLRSDFEPRFLSSEALKSHWTQARFPVRAMRSDELRQAIERPATEMALYFEPSNLVDKLIDEVGQMPGALPLLSFTLSELYLKLAEKWTNQETTDRALTLDADFDKEGGVAGSLTRRANQEYDGLPDDAHKATMRRVMLRMVAIEGGESARRRVPLSELVYADKQDPNKTDDEENKRVELVLERLNHARLIVCGQETGEPYAEPAHDFLVRSWNKLQKWQQEEQENLSLQRRLTPAAIEWKSKEQSSSLLGKTEPFWDWCDKKIDSVIYLWNEINKKDAQELRRQRKGQFLWNGNPYLDVLKKRLKSYDYWFNQVETEFVQQSLWQRRRDVYLFWAAIGSAFLVLMGILLATYIQKELADLRVKAATAKDILPYNPLNGLLLAIESTGRSQSPILKRFLGVNFSFVQSSLRVATEEAQERDILPGISPVAISPNGQYIATTLEGKISLWDMWDKNIWRNKEGNPKVELPVKVEDDTLITFSPDSQKILTITSAGQMQLWTVQGNPIDGFPVSMGNVNSVAFSSNGEMIATGSLGRVQLWTVQGNPIDGFPVPGGNVNSVAFSPNGQTIVTGSDGSPGRVQLWNLRGNPGYGFPVPDGAVNSVAFSPDGRMIVAGSAGNSGKVWLWNLHSNKTESFHIPKVKHEADLYSVAFTSDSQKIISISHSQVIDARGGPVVLRLWNPKGKLIQQSLYYAPEIAVSANGHFAVTGSSGGSASPLVKLWDLQSNPINVFSGHNGSVTSVAISPDGQTIVSGSDDKTVRLWNLQGQSRILDHGDIVNSVAISPDGQTIVSGSDDKTVRLWDIQGNPIGQPLKHEAQVKKVAISPDGQKIISASGEIFAKAVHVWDIQGNFIRQFSPDLNIESIAFYDNQTLIIGWGDNGGSLRLFNLQGEPVTETFQTRNQNNIGKDVTSIAVSPDGKTIVAGGNESVRLWNRRGKLVGNSFPNSSIASSVAFSSDGQYIVTGNDKTVRLRDNQGSLIGEPLQIYEDKIHEDNGTVTSVAISRDGQYIVSGNEDGTVRLWRAGNWQTWLQIACNRLQYHPALNNSWHLNELDGSEVNRGARATCQKYWK